MTKAQHILIESLLSSGNYYLMPKRKHTGTNAYMLYQGNANPVKSFSDATYRKFKQLYKKDSNGRVTLNLTKVRSLHGKNKIKKLYKQHHQLFLK